MENKNLANKKEHHSHHDHHHHHADIKNIKVAFFLNLGFTVFEIAGGIFTNSIAILSDAIHDLGDSLSLGMAWYFQKISKRESNSIYTYGYKRFSLLGAIINSLVLVAGSVYILTEAIPRLIEPQETNARGMFLLAIVGVLVNGAAALRLKKGKSLNEKAVSLHMLEDLFGWLAILVGSVVMYFFDFPVLDPLMSIGIACFVLFNVYKNIRQSLRIILQGIPNEIEISTISSFLNTFEEVENIHDLHIWTVDGMYNVLTVHVVLKKPLNDTELVALKSKIRSILKENEIQHATIEFESPDEKCMFENCCD